MIEIKAGNVSTEIIPDEASASSLKALLLRDFKVEIPGAKFTWAVMQGLSDDMACLWEKNEEDNIELKIRSGLLPRLIAALNKANIEFTVSGDNRGLTSPKLSGTKVPLFPYQYEAVKAAFGNTTDIGWTPRGVLEVATGGGKTEIAVAMYEMNPVPTFFLVHRKDLLLQAKERFLKYGHKSGIIGDSKFQPEANLNIATLQTLKKILIDPRHENYKRTVKLIQSCKQVFFDECHLFASNLDKGNEFIAVADAFEAPYRWGLTATPFMRSQYDNMLLEGVAGPSIYKIGYADLVKLGRLTPAKVIIKRVDAKIGVTAKVSIRASNKSKGDYWREVESKGIKSHEKRTALIIKEIESGPFPLLVLVKTKEQAEYIQSVYQGNARNDGYVSAEPILFLSGSSKAKDRREAIKEMGAGNIDVIMATTIFDEGVDVPNLRKVVLASGGKSDVKAIQRVGRALRKSEGKDEAIIIDFDDRHHALLKRHAQARQAVYKEQGYIVEFEGEKI